MSIKKQVKILNHQAIQFNVIHHITHHRKIYEPKQMPPDWKFAQIHGKSTKPGFINKKQYNYKCPCCLNTINKQLIPYCEDIKQLAFLGQGFPLIYNFLKYCIIMLGAIVINNCALSIYLNIQQFVCFTPTHNNGTQTRLLDNSQDLPTCQGTAFNQLAFMFTGTTQNIRQILNIISFVTHGIILIYFRQQQSSLANYLDERNTTISDFSVLIKNIPTGNQKNKIKIQKLISKLCPEMRIMEILIIEKLNEYFELQKQLNEIIDLKKQALNKKQLSVQQMEQISKKFQEKQEQIYKLTKHMQLNEKKYFQGTGFVILNSELDKNSLIKTINNASDQIIMEFFPNYKEMNKKMKAQQAGQPNQIDWKNVHFIKKQRIFAIVMSWFIFLIILGVVMGIYYEILDTKTKKIILIQHLKEHYQDAYPEIVSARFLGYFLVIIINFLNKFVLSWIAHKLTHHQRHILYTDLQFSFALKYMLGMFFTTALMTLIVEAAIQSNYSDTLGVVEEQTFMFMFNAVFSPIIWLINPYNIIIAIKRKIYKGSNNLTQQQANQIMELYPYDIGKRYAENMKTMWFTFLYIQLIPIGAVFSLFGILLYYVIDKYVLLRRSSVKEAISVSLSTSMITILQFTLVLKPLGEIIFTYQLYGQVAISSIVMIILGLLFMCLPLKTILNWLFAQKFLLQQKTYEQAKDSFTSNYITSYPLRQQQTNIKNYKDGVLPFIIQKNQKSQDPQFDKAIYTENLQVVQLTKNRLMF